MKARYHRCERAPRIARTPDLERQEQGITVPETWFRERYANTQWQRFTTDFMEKMPGHQDLVALTRTFKTDLAARLSSQTWDTLRTAWSLRRIPDPTVLLDRKTILFQQIIDQTPVDERTPDRLHEHLQRSWTPMAVRHRERLTVLSDPALYQGDTHPRTVLERLWNTAAEDCAEGMTRTFQGVAYDRRLINGRVPSYHQVRQGEVSVEDVLAATTAGDRAEETAAAERAARRAAGLREAVSLVKAHFARSESTHLPRLRQIIERGSQGRLFLETERAGTATRAILHVGRPGSGWRVPGPESTPDRCAEDFLRFLALEAAATTLDPSYDNTLRYDERHAAAVADQRPAHDVIRAA
jgi:hypothetical protein